MCQTQLLLFAAFVAVAAARQAEADAAQTVADAAAGNVVETAHNRDAMHEAAAQAGELLFEEGNEAHPAAYQGTGDPDPGRGNDADTGGSKDGADSSGGFFADILPEHEEDVERETLDEALGKANANTVRAVADDTAVAVERAVQATDSIVEYAKDLGMEVLKTVKRDLNAVVGLLPAPVAKPIRETAQVVSDTALRVLSPALMQAERYTRGMRQGLGRSIGRGVTLLKEDVLPRVGRVVVGLAGKAKRRIGDAMRKRHGAKEADEQEGEGRISGDGVVA